MKLEVSYHSGFSENLFGWGAILFVGHGGSFSCRWFDGSQGHERSLKRHDFGLGVLTFERLSAALAALPSPLQDFNDDDAPKRIISAARDGRVVERSLIPDVAQRTLSESEEEFNRIWEELVELVLPAFARLEIDSKLLKRS